MFEDRTADLILNEMLGFVDDSLDKREGSMIYNALGPVAVMVAALYADLGAVVDEMFADTAGLESLKKIGAERGIVYREAESAIISAKIVTGGEEPEVGSRFFSNDIFYVYRGMKSDDGSEYLLECETAGAAGNISSGSLVYDGGSYVESATVTGIVVFGQDAETLEELRSRYYDSFESLPFGGNEADYKERTIEGVEGIGGVKVLRPGSYIEPEVYTLEGTVTLILISDDFGAPGEDTVRKAEEYWETFAPICHSVDVRAVGVDTVSVSTVIECQEGYDVSKVQAAAEEIVRDYFKTVCADWADKGEGVLRIGRIESVLSSVEGIIEASDTKINGGGGNISYKANTIPGLGEMVLSEAVTA